MGFKDSKMALPFSSTPFRNISWRQLLILFSFWTSLTIQLPFWLKTIAWGVVYKRRVSCELGPVSSLNGRGGGWGWGVTAEGHWISLWSLWVFVKCVWRGTGVAMVICVYFYPPHPLCSPLLIQHTVMADLRKLIMCCDSGAEACRFICGEYTVLPLCMCSRMIAIVGIIKLQFGEQKLPVAGWEGEQETDIGGNCSSNLFCEYLLYSNNAGIHACSWHLIKSSIYSFYVK